MSPQCAKVLAVVLVIFCSVTSETPKDSSSHTNCEVARCLQDTNFLVALFRGIKLHKKETDEETVIAPVRARCLDYNLDKKEVYAYINDTIMRYSTGAKALLPGHVTIRTETAVTSIAVDWKSDLIYFVAEQRSAIYVTSREGSDPQLLVSTNDTKPSWRSLVVDPYSKKLFWIGKTGVNQFSLQGKEHSTGLMPWLNTVDGISLDISRGLIYAIGQKANGINKVITRANYSNFTSKGLVEDSTVEVGLPANNFINGFAVVGKIAYWESNYDGENIYKCDLGADKSPIPTVVVAELNQVVFDMKVVNNDLQPLK